MRKIMMLAVVLCFTISLAFAESPAIVTLKGYIIDNICASTQKVEHLAEYVKLHPKDCAVMPSCAEAGYSIFFDGKLMKFDKKSNIMIERFLNKPDSKLQVVVKAKKIGDALSLVSIVNQ